MKTLRLACNAFPPARNLCSIKSNLAASVSCRDPGVDAEYVHAILKGSGVPFELTPVPFSLIKKLGYVRALYEFVNSAQADGSCAIFAATEWRLRNFESPGPFRTGAKMVGTSIDKNNFYSWLKFANVIDWRIILTCLTIFLSVKFVEKLFFPYVFGDFTTGRYRCRLLRTWSFTYGILDLAVGLFLGLYTSLLVSSLLVPNSRLQFRDIDELSALLERNKIHIHQPHGSDWPRRLEPVLNVTSTVRRFREALIKNPPLYDSYNLADTVAASFYQDTTTIYSSETLQALTKNYCDMQLVELPELRVIYPDQAMLIFNRNISSHVLALINRSIVKNLFIITAIREKYRRKSLRKTSNCLRKSSDESKVQYRTRFQQIVGVLLLFATGCLCGIVSLGIERLYKRDESQEDTGSSDQPESEV